LYVLPILLFSVCYNLTRFFELETRYNDATSDKANANATSFDSDNGNATDLGNGAKAATASNETYLDPEIGAWNLTSGNGTGSETPGFELVPTKIRTNYYYYTIYLVMFFD
jgi:hypothetical protein